MIPPDERFMAMVQRDESGCWLWKGTRTKPGDAGYGLFFYKGSKGRTCQRSAQAAYEKRLWSEGRHSTQLRRSNSQNRSVA